MIDIDNASVRDIAAGSPDAVRVFERLGIDYCCGGKRLLADVCREKGLELQEVAHEIETAAAARRTPERDWNVAPLTGLIRHIVGTHHEFLRRELPLIGARLEKVYRVYNESYGPTLVGLPEVFGALHGELDLHLRKEEMILFPAIETFEAAAVEERPLPQTPFGPIANPVRMMESEHDSAGGALARIREITQNFSAPAHACETYRALMASLEGLEHDLHTHIHLENNVLFPRAMRLEDSMR
jgi:regulator of cell morphogenesis and NO signaling